MRGIRLDEKRKKRLHSQRCEKCEVEREHRWRKENPEKARKYDQEWFAKHREKQRERCRINSAKHRKTLSNAYVRSLLAHRSFLSAADIPQELIEAKRAEIKIKRYLREQSK
jgi:hypothetical protein